ncbi:MAG: peptide chain release factor N(5)-glutamine methyltransferase [Candidatus Gracilibacteria bacterium]|jgi:release factor glutamine methyltransferase
MKIYELLNIGTNLLGKRSDAPLIAEVLLAYVIGKEKEYLIGHTEEDVSEEDGVLFLNYISRARNGEPLSYITQEKEFFGIDFFVDKRVLIPRPETEMLVIKALEFIGQEKYVGSGVRILDIGTGSGNIAISLAKNLQDKFEYEIDAIDISSDAIDVASVNVTQHGVEFAVNLILSDLLEEIEEESFYDVIVSNLTYIGEKINDFVEENVKKFEPDSALFAGDDGLALYEKLFKQINEKNIKFKILIGEIGDEQEDQIKELVIKYFGIVPVIERDLSGLPRMFYLC